MTQHDLVRAYIKQYGSILPAKLPGLVYMGQMFGSETSKRCRELRKKGELYGKKDGKFERFFFKKPIELPPAYKPKPEVEESKQMSIW